MDKKIEVLTMKIQNKHVSCLLDEITKVISHESGIMDYTGTGRKQQTPFFSLKTLLGITVREMKSTGIRKKTGIENESLVKNSLKENEYSTLLLVKNKSGEHVCIGIKGGVDIKKINKSKIMIVPDYIRRKQNPFVVWGYVMEDNDLHTLITFSHL